MRDCVRHVCKYVVDHAEQACRLLELVGRVLALQTNLGTLLVVRGMFLHERDTDILNLFSQVNWHVTHFHQWVFRLQEKLEPNKKVYID